MNLAKCPLGGGAFETGKSDPEVVFETGISLVGKTLTSQYGEVKLANGPLGPIWMNLAKVHSNGLLIEKRNGLIMCSLAVGSFGWIGRALGLAAMNAVAARWGQDPSLDHGYRFGTYLGASVEQVL